ncbi:hypothetical protein AMTRI_Chr04g251180 [Amborella trichopoda]
MAMANNRRALGDIGNLVGALSTRCVVTKGQSLQENRGLTTKKKIYLPVDRPITRSFGAILEKKQTLAKKEERIDEEEDNVKWRSKQRRTMSSRKKKTQNENDPIDAFMEEREKEDAEVVITQGKHLENKDFTADATSTETSYLSCEIEMEDAESPLPCIDELDVKNPLAVVEYVKDIYSFYRKTEFESCVPADYMSNQPDINHRMRAILVDWLIEVHYKFEVLHETLFLAINLIDRYLSCQSIARKSLQLVGITGMLLACKYEEVYLPALEDFLVISDRAYTRDDVLKMEKSMLNTLQFKMSVPTPFVFMKRFLKAAESDIKLEMMSFYLMELSMVEYRMLKFSPSLLSAAAVYTGRRILRLSPLWSNTLKSHTTYTEDKLQECVKWMEEICQGAGQGKLTSVFRKYSVSKFGGVASLLNTSPPPPPLP